MQIGRPPRLRDAARDVLNRHVDQVDTHSPNVTPMRTHLAQTPSMPPSGSAHPTLLPNPTDKERAG